MIDSQTAAFLTAGLMLFIIFIIFHIILPLIIPGLRGFLLSTGPKSLKHHKK